MHKLEHCLIDLKSATLTEKKLWAISDRTVRSHMCSIQVPVQA